MVTKFLKKMISKKNSSDQDGSISANPGVINLKNNKKPPYYFSPFTPKNIIGRDSDIDELVQKKKQTRFLIIGDQQFKGIGKTAFALRTAKKFATQYPEGQVYIDLKPNGRKPLTIIEVMAQVIWHFKVQCNLEDSEEKLRTVYLKTLFNKKIILLLDGVTHPMEVFKLLPPKTCLMIVVSQERITLPGFYRKSMKPLVPNAAQNLLLLHAPNIKKKVKEIAELCEFIPMTLCMVGGFLASSKSFTEEVLYEKLQQFAKGNLLLEIIGQSYKDLEKDTACVFRKLFIFPDTFDAKAEDFVCQDANNDHLAKLVKRQMVTFNEKSQRYQLHPFIQKFLRNHLTETEKSDAEKRHATHFMIRLQGLNIKLQEITSSSTHSSVNAFDSDWGNYQSAQEWALQRLGATEEDNHLCASFPENGAQFLKWRLPPKICMQWFDSGISAAKYLKDGKAELRQMINLSSATFDSKNYWKAKELHEDSLKLALEMGEDSNAITLLDKLAFFQAALKNHSGAIEYYEQALEIFKKNEDVECQINILLKIAATYSKMGATSDSIDFLKQALEIAEKTGANHEERMVLSQIGKAFFKSGDYQQAREYHENALVLDRKLNDSYGEACDLLGLSLALEKLNHIKEAIKNGKTAFKIFKVQKKKEAKLMYEKLKSWENLALV